ncbi:MAG TPA: L-glutamate gamma-semialdehyde dehydrogenase, partial [Propionibacteriaceae bacterium]|nr:L-glutamate gamma-semialdehyde dehydrogenase [Propionibacteriaceae bacterium]
HVAGTAERAALETALSWLRGGGHEVPVVIGGREIRTGRKFDLEVPHDHSARLGTAHEATAAEVETAITVADSAARDWGTASAADRIAPFARAADMLQFGPWRERLVAATMVELSKTAQQADGDVAEAVDFLRVNIANLKLLESVQPASLPGVSNHVDYRPLEGFVLAVSPFNFTSMNNLAFAPALLGNTVLWKPAESASLVAYLSLQLLREAGLPDGVISLLPGNGSEIGGVALAHRSLAAVHFTGSTTTLRHIWRTVGANVDLYRDYPRIVGEAGGKDFIIAHPSADLEALAVACLRGAFDYQGQKCAAASRIYVPSSLWSELRGLLIERTAQLVVGDPTQPGTQLGAVINARQHAKHTAALSRARAQGVVIAGGTTDDANGWFVDPTILEVDDPDSEFMIEELFAPIMAVHVYADGEWEKMLDLVDSSTEYALTGAVFANHEFAILQADRVLRYAAGNYYINDKPTGAAVGQQPFGGARASGTNDKAGTVWNLIRFASPRAVKRTHVLDHGLDFPALD